MKIATALPSEQTFRIMADSSPVLLWLSGRDALCTFFNQGWLDFTGRTMEQELGLGWAEGIWPEDFRECVDTYMRAFNKRQPFEMTYRLRRHDGQYRWILDRGVPWYIADGIFQGFIGSCVDITDMKEAENRTRHMAFTLERAHRQIERFLFAFSHDVREPVCTAINHAERALQELGGEKHLASRQQLDQVLDATTRIRDLVDGLQRFTLIFESKSDAHRPISLDEALDEALGKLALTINAARVTITRGALPTVHGNQRQIVLLLHQLIDNAVKFRSRNAPHINITAERIGEEWRIAIKDNGIGIDSGSRNTIFVMFRRLVPHNQYPGSGIGLTLCKEIVDLHGGRIWCESSDSGTVFQFTLPATTSDHIEMADLTSQQDKIAR